MIHHIPAHPRIRLTPQFGLVPSIATVVLDASHSQRNGFPASPEQFLKLLPGFLGGKVFQVVFNGQGKHDIESCSGVAENGPCRRCGPRLPPEDSGCGTKWQSSLSGEPVR